VFLYVRSMPCGRDNSIAVVWVYPVLQAYSTHLVPNVVNSDYACLEIRCLIISPTDGGDDADVVQFA